MHDRDIGKQADKSFEMTIELHYATTEDYPKISKFLDQYWERDYIYVRKPELFDWTFGRNELWNQEGYSFALMEDRDELVGILGAIPFNFNCLGRKTQAVWFANYMIRPDYRRGPLGMRLLGAFQGYKIKTVFGVNSRVVPIYQRLGWAILPPIPRHFMILRDAVRRAARVIRTVHPEYADSDAEKLAGFFQIRDIPESSVCYDNAIPTDWNAKDWSELASNSIGAARDLDYLKWRYLNHPCFDYRFLAVPEKNRTGLAVWRLEVIRRLTPQGHADVDVIGRLVEFLPASHKNAKTLFSVFCRELVEAGALGADFYGYHSKYSAWLNEFGFHLVSDHPDGVLIPSRLQPLDSRPGNILGAIISEDKLPSHPEASNCSWYWTKSDADQDRPN
jgi:GNAT superfamily N-acetyltransferase